MPSFFFEKSVSILLPLFVVVAFIVLIFYAFATTAFIEPADQAPFVQEMVAAHEKKGEDKITPLAQPHRSESEIKNYLTVITSEILSFNRGNFSETAKKIRPYFTDSGFQKFQKYLLDTGIAETVRTQDVSLSSYVDVPPFIINNMAMNEVYKWVYDVPVVINYVPLGQVEDPAEAATGEEFYVRVQLTRAHDPENEFNGIKIEDWNVLRR
jgi:hypothetical protein